MTYIPIYEYSFYVSLSRKDNHVYYEDIQFTKRANLITKEDEFKLYIEGFRDDYGYIWKDNPETIQIEAEEGECLMLTMFSFEPNAEEYFKEKVIRELIHNKNIRDIIVKEWKKEDD